MFSIFKKKYEGATDLSGIKTDMHSHILPGIDDGAQDEEQSLQLIKGLQELGYDKFIATPHVLSDMFPNDRETITGALSKLSGVLGQNNQRVDLSAAAEYYLDDHFSALLESNTPLLTLTDKYVLVEFPFVSAPYNYKEQLFQLQLCGYQPVLAHPERYEYWHGKFSQYEKYFDQEIIFQLNINSLTGQYGPGVRRISERLIDKGMIQFLGSDCHHVGHLNLMDTARESSHLKKLIDSGMLLNATL